MAGALTNRGRGNSKTIGRLRHRVKIQYPNESSRDESGAVVSGVWTDIATVWASVEPVSGREQLASGQVQADTTHRVLMRHRADLTPKHRLVWLTSRPVNKVLNVTTVLPTVGVGNSLEVLCIEEV